MYIDVLKEKLACQIAEATYDKYQADAYGLSICKDCYSEHDVRTKRMLLDLLDNYTKQIGCKCNLDKIKDLR